MKWYTWSWLRPSKRSASVLRPLGVSKRYGFSTRSQGRARRSALSASRWRVSSFSLASSFFRAASHSSFDRARFIAGSLSVVTDLARNSGRPGRSGVTRATGLRANDGLLDHRGGTRASLWRSPGRTQAGGPEGRSVGPRAARDRDGAARR